LGLATLLIPPLLGIFTAVIRPLIDQAGGENVGIPLGFCTVILALILSISALVVSIRAFRKGERSWVLWLGFVPALLIGTFWIFMVVGEFLFPH
jgi:CHASE2 domain-containing sensor protein